MCDIGPRKALVWGALCIAIAAPLALAAISPLLAWRQPIYIAAGFAGVIALALLLLQPLLAGGYLPGLTVFRERRIHRWIGVSLLAAVLVHVIGLWITSPPDVIDALLFTSPTPFSDWDVIAMWALFATAVLAALRKRLGLRWRIWRGAHGALAVVIVLGSVVHAMLIDGTMEVISKTALCALVIIATAKTLTDLRVWRLRKSTR
ncbi:ferric reductase-like transmembrane domain-containing protein [Roseovarius sp. S4756]|uniref:ferric reductase-like transmembrane domain-containing protein n=1 Tax=Roseovarius maritimus TaxID=3342637 RepID=UPI00372B37FA